jgi:hypothetical protein
VKVKCTTVFFKTKQQGAPVERARQAEDPAHRLIRTGVASFRRRSDEDDGQPLAGRVAPQSSHPRLHFSVTGPYRDENVREHGTEKVFRLFHR